ncbi:uncharacterized protein LOC124942625 isoform X2 [Impatiens glandulifera]|uniref:uncharacterized protein LOC124942625 isoform X2 n=1 Tax=Impatiens glandulifera TaxID=253017 RepID=UPI001FB10297|nr:uncharacterized protein LOC124942625 isoform X2 [Impatiens glandulifera]
MDDKTTNKDMAATADAQSQNDVGSFVWDEKSQLYYHASTGFYHDPSAGWYYNSGDGLYYKFENGNYALLGPPEQVDGSDAHISGDNLTDHSIQYDPEPHIHGNDKLIDQSFQEGESEMSRAETTTGEPAAEHTKCSNSLSGNPAPPSEWLEDTLIELYLSGYKNQAVDSPCDSNILSEKSDGVNLGYPVDGNVDEYELEEGEWIPDESQTFNQPSGDIPDEGTSLEEINWLAQYGQVIQPDQELLPDLRSVDLWDWSMVRVRIKGRKKKVGRLVGRLVKQSARLHPSMPSGGFLFKTAPICEARLDLVRVTTGQLYKLRTPSTKYLASLSTYDSSDPTKDWHYPHLSVGEQIQVPEKPSENHHDYRMINNNNEGLNQDDVMCSSKSNLDKHTSGSGLYRDRAAERRALHGSFGVGPGQKKSTTDIISSSPPSSPDNADEAANEALNMSFGVGSYARRLMEGMGWKEGEALGSSNREGIIEPLQAIGNKGGAGLGWEHGRQNLPNT